MITASFINQKALDFQIDRYTVVREYFQLLFLRYLYRQKLQGMKLFFKGGTAIRFLFNSFRFSEDLDFTGLGRMKKIEEVLKQILPDCEKESGFKIMVKDEKLFEEVGVGYRLVLQPNELIKQPLGIRLDFSFREKPLEPEVSSIAVFDYPITPFPLVTHLSKKEILAEKVRAILTRETPRDLFDLWFLLKQGTLLEWDFVIKKMKYYPEVKFDKKILEKEIQKFKPEELKKDLNQFLPANYRDYYSKITEEILTLVQKNK